jgi:hypothetical protein
MQKQRLTVVSIRHLAGASNTGTEACVANTRQPVENRNQSPESQPLSVGVVVLPPGFHAFARPNQSHRLMRFVAALDGAMPVEVSAPATVGQRQKLVPQRGKGLVVPGQRKDAGHLCGTYGPRTS